MGKIIEANCETGEVTEREMTAEEQAIHDSMIADTVISQELAMKETEAQNTMISLVDKITLLEQQIASLQSK